MAEITPGEFIVLGMHRSGTSMVSGVLNRLGVDMGEDLPGRQISNPLGHFEDGDFLDLNTRILALAGGSWDNPPSEQEILSVGESLSGEIKNLIYRRRQSYPDKSWGWKDPRTSLTIRLYLPYLNNPFMIWCQRDPGEIARSLEKRNDLSREVSLNLIALYHARIVGFIENNPQIPVHVIRYRDIVNQPHNQIVSLIDFLGLSIDQDLVDQAVRLVLPPGQLHREKTLMKLKYWISLPGRAFRKYFLKSM
jgi:hypothetical protein